MLVKLCLRRLAMLAETVKKIQVSFVKVVVACELWSQCCTAVPDTEVGRQQQHNTGSHFKAHQGRMSVHFMSAIELFSLSNWAISIGKIPPPRPPKLRGFAVKGLPLSPPPPPPAAPLGYTIQAWGGLDPLEPPSPPPLPFCPKCRMSKLLRTDAIEQF